MPHIHKLIDFVVDIFIVYKDKILLIHHRGQNKWLPIGGHIELDEDPEQALFREIKEECGLEIEILGEKPLVQSPIAKFLYPPVFLDIHKISDTHKHVGLFYFAKAKNDKAVLNQREHKGIKWFSKEDLDNPDFNLDPIIIFCAKEALKKLAW